MQNEQEPPSPEKLPLLDYSDRRQQNSDHPSAIIQFTYGFLFWIICTILAASISAVTLNPYGFALAALILFGTAAFGAVWVRQKWKWRSFIPGMLLGLGLTCLLPIGYVLIICGPNGGRL